MGTCVPCWSPRPATDWRLTDGDPWWRVGERGLLCDGKPGQAEDSGERDMQRQMDCAARRDQAMMRWPKEDESVDNNEWIRSQNQMRVGDADEERRRDVQLMVDKRSVGGCVGTGSYDSVCVVRVLKDEGVSS